MLSMKGNIWKLLSVLLGVVLVFSAFMVLSLPSAKAASDKLLVGYWHNFDNNTLNVKLKDVDARWDVINVSFAETNPSDQATMVFAPYNLYSSVDEFKSDVNYLKSKGKKVQISLGGQNGVVALPDAAARDRFVNSMKSIINTYGFTGLDIDLEQNMHLAAGDTDFKNPKTPHLVNLIAGVRAICDSYGAGFSLTMAPETAYVQGGIGTYASLYGAYLPVIYGLRDKLTFIHVQHYNSGGMEGLDGKTYAQGTADFEVAMAEMLLRGFPVARNSSNIFPALRPDQVMYGIPACSGAAGGGYINPTENKKALNYLIKGVSYGGAYQLQNPSGYSGFKGLMTWSINWDLKNGNEFLNNYRPYFDSLSSSTSNPPPTGAVNTPTTKVNTSTPVPTAVSYTNTPVPTSSGSYPAWNRSSVYTGGNMVSYNGKVWKAKWWTQGEEPGVAAVWDLQSGSVATNTPTPKINTNTPVPTTAVSNTPVPTKVNTPTPGSGGSYSAWNSTNTYYAVGAKVSWNGSNYECTFAHYSNTAWAPDVATTLWKKI